MQKSIFRQNAINHLHSLDEMDASMKVIQPGAWLYMLLILLIFLAILTFCLMGRLTLTVSGSGIILSESRIDYVEKLINENKRERKARLMQLKKILDIKRMLYKNHLLTIADIEKSEQEYFSAKYNFMNGSVINLGEELSIFDVEPELNQDSYALVFIRNSEGKIISRGMTAYILPDRFSQYEYGYIKGKVIDVSRYPVTRELVYSYLGNMNLVEEYFSRGAPFLVKIRLEKNESTASKLSWTSNKGPPFDIDVGTTVTVKIIHHSASPIKYIFNTEVN